ncbi:MAG: hypothetical protein ACO3M2_13045 [Pseudohongiellaceae bacterium]|tara:strand:+ start:142 stop:357 length:216 start_codon:yes stop_codon:yes gene_type:complete
MLCEEHQNELFENWDIEHMTEQQQKAVKDIMVAVTVMVRSYSELVHPDYEDCVNLDRAWHRMRWAFKSKED